MKKPPLFRTPLYTDWTIWLGLFAVLAGVMGVIGDYSNPNVTPGVNGGMTGSMAIDLIFAVAFQWALFAMLPAAIRRGRRQAPSKAKEATEQTLVEKRNPRVEYSGYYVDPGKAQREGTRRDSTLTGQPD